MSKNRFDARRTRLFWVVLSDFYPIDGLKSFLFISSRHFLFPEKRALLPLIIIYSDFCHRYASRMSDA